MNKAFQQAFRVYYENTDAGGVVYHADYLKFLERTRTEWLRSLALEQDDLRDRHGIVFAVSRMEIDYLYPARFNDLLDVTCAVLRQRRASILFEQTLGRQDGTLCCTARVTVACVSFEHFRPTAIPPDLSSRIADATKA